MQRGIKNINVDATLMRASNQKTKWRPEEEHRLNLIAHLVLYGEEMLGGK